ncbi:MAG: ABC transporter ATP-binding protein [Blastochloris sp.]|nr:ABC transporter ATP-binding protein [Blastochloris sp.]
MKTLLKVEQLSIRFHSANDSLLAVDQIGFSLGAGETLAIVGESGSGKSVTALALTRLLPSPPSCQIEGAIELEGQDILKLSAKELMKIRGKRIAYIFQEPSTSLNPVFSIRSQIAEVLALHRPEIKDHDAEIVRLLDLVGIRDARKRLHDYPHQLSGGMQQRVMIAMALACQPDILVADEPTTALDVTIQAQIMNLLKDLKARLSMSVILITHNFGIVAGFADRVLVMYKGKIVEEGSASHVLHQPQHPYTRALIDCIPRLGQKKQRLTTIDYSEIS